MDTTPQQPSASNDAAPKSFYANGFQISISNADAEILFRLGGKTELVLFLSYTTAKTLAEGLAESVKRLEAVTETTILTTKSVEAKLKADQESRKGA